MTPQTSPGAQLDLTNLTVFRGLERKESIWENMGLNWVTEFQSREFALRTTWYIGGETETPPTTAPKINPRPITLQKCKKNILVTQILLYLFLTHQNHTVGEIRFKSNIQLIPRIKNKRVLFICNYLTWVLF